MVEKEFVTMDEDTIIIDAVKVIRDTVYLLYSLQNQVQESPFILYGNLVEQKNILYDFINVENSLKELYVSFRVGAKPCWPLARMQRLSKTYVHLTTDRLFQA